MLAEIYELGCVVPGWGSIKEMMLREPLQVAFWCLRSMPVKVRHLTIRKANQLVSLEISDLRMKRSIVL
jgi:hypothetical protein